MGAKRIREESLQCDGEKSEGGNGVVAYGIVQAEPGLVETWDNEFVQARLRYWTDKEWERLPVGDRPANARRLGDLHVTLEVDWV